MATMEFNKAFSAFVYGFKVNKGEDISSEDMEVLKAYEKSKERGAMFDARAFSIPKEEVTNLIYWRQQDAMRNAVQMVGQAFYSHKELQGVNCEMLKEMLLADKGIDWDKIPVKYQRGSCCVKVDGEWTIDNNISIFRGSDREQIDKLVFVESEEN
jgi:tRNA(His) 5'-end guanylyltransferase